MVSLPLVFGGLENPLYSLLQARKLTLCNEFHSPFYKPHEHFMQIKITTLFFSMYLAFHFCMHSFR